MKVDFRLGENLRYLLNNKCLYPSYSTDSDLLIHHCRGPPSPLGKADFEHRLSFLNFVKYANHSKQMIKTKHIYNYFSNCE